MSEAFFETPRKLAGHGVRDLLHGLPHVTGNHDPCRLRNGEALRHHVTHHARHTVPFAPDDA
jgi:hypothetical protein